MKNGICNILGNNIKTLRKSRGITQFELAELVNLDVKSLSLIETGKGFATAKTLEKLSLILKVPVSDLFVDCSSQDNEELYSGIISNLELIKNNNAKLQTVNIVLKSLV